MSVLREYPNDADPSTYRDHTAEGDIVAAAARSGILFERWRADHALPAGAGQAEVLAVYHESVERLSRERGFATADVVRMSPETPNHEAIRLKFLEEHTHAEDEARFFVEGAGLFVIHRAPSVIAVLCEAGDLIDVPAGTPHWFDMGPRPRFAAIRLFTSQEGWVARYTGSDIAARFSRMGEGRIV